jgi:hypothetical protein
MAIGFAVELPMGTYAVDLSAVAANGVQGENRPIRNRALFCIRQRLNS